MNLKVDSLPKNLDAEEAVVGSVFIDPDVLDEVMSHVAVSDFLYTHNRVILDACVWLRDQGKPIDPITVAKRLGGKLDEIGGPAVLRKAVEAVPTSFNAVHYAKIVRECSVRRQAIVTGQNLVTGSASNRDISAVISEAEADLFAMRDRAIERKPILIAKRLADSVARLDARLSGVEPIGLSTGFVGLDDKLSGLHRGELVLLAARPSMGKTALAINIARNVCRGGGRVLVFSLEMSAMELADRLLSAESGVPLKRMRSGQVNHDDCERLVNAGSALSQMRMLVDDYAGRTTSEIGGLARQAKRQQDEGGLDLIVVDYLQLIEPSDSRDHRHEQVAKMGRHLKQIARTVDVPLICVAQLNRQPEAQADKRPRLSHLRESGTLEQDADVVMFVHRDDYYATTEEDRMALKGKAVCIVAKHRNGPTGDVPLRWDPDCVRFSNAANGSAIGHSDWTEGQL